MAIPSSGPLALAATIQTEFGGSAPTSISEYYAGGAYVPSGATGINGALPSSGQISFSKFYGVAKGWIASISSIVVNGNGYSPSQPQINITTSSSAVYIPIYNSSFVGYSFYSFDKTSPNTNSFLFYDGRINNNINYDYLDYVNGGLYYTTTSSPGYLYRFVDSSTFVTASDPIYGRTSFALGTDSNWHIIGAEGFGQNRLTLQVCSSNIVNVGDSGTRVTKIYPVGTSLGGSIFKQADGSNSSSPTWFNIINYSGSVNAFIVRADDNKSYIVKTPSSGSTLTYTGQNSGVTGDYSRVFVDSSGNYLMVGKLIGSNAAVVCKYDQSLNLLDRKIINSPISSFPAWTVEYDATENCFYIGGTYLISSIYNRFVLLKYNYSSNTVSWIREFINDDNSRNSYFYGGFFKVDSTGIYINAWAFYSTGRQVIIKYPKDGSVTGTYAGVSTSIEASSLSFTTSQGSVPTEVIGTIAPDVVSGSFSVTGYNDPPPSGQPTVSISLSTGNL